MTVMLDKPQRRAEVIGPAPEDEVKEFLWTVASLYRAIDAGVFEHPERLELIQGRIIEHMGQNPPHSTLVAEIADMLRAAFSPRYAVREEKPIHIAFDGEPIPDVAVVMGKQSDYWEHHPAPQDVALLVEVADSSAAYDLGEKALLYSQAGITDYWVVLLNESAIVQHREPTPEGYQSVTRLTGADAVSPLAAPEVVWTIQTLLGREE